MLLGIAIVCIIVACPVSAQGPESRGDSHRADAPRSYSRTNGQSSAQSYARPRSEDSHRRETYRGTGHSRTDSRERSYRGNASQRTSTGDVYQRSSDVYQRSGDVYQRSGDVYQSSGDVYKRSGDVHQRSGDVYQRSGDAYQRTSDVRDSSRTGDGYRAADSGGYSRPESNGYHDGRSGYERGSEVAYRSVPPPDYGTAHSAAPPFGAEYGRTATGRSTYSGRVNPQDL